MSSGEGSSSGTGPGSKDDDDSRKRAKTSNDGEAVESPHNFVDVTHSASPSSSTSDGIPSNAAAASSPPGPKPITPNLYHFPEVVDKITDEKMKWFWKCTSSTCSEMIVVHEYGRFETFIRDHVHLDERPIDFPYPMTFEAVIARFVDIDEPRFACHFYCQICQEIVRMNPFNQHLQTIQDHKSTH